MGQESVKWNGTDSLTQVRIWIPFELRSIREYKSCSWRRSVRKSLARLQRLAVPILLPALAKMRVTLWPPPFIGNWVSCLISES